MARVRSVDFLPEIFQTDANKQFLAATLDQLIQEPKFKKTQGFIGRTVGPGVNPNDKYVVEPNKTRADYQLEPGVINLVPDTNTIKNAITYPGMNDAIAYQGGDSTRPDLLYESNYYTWDSFTDYDAFVNFAQYYWLPSGPAVVEVAATGVPFTDNFIVTREDGVYTFSGANGNNPTIELVRGGSYTFQVSQNNKETVNYRVKNSGSSAYVIDFANNPALTLARGNTYVFNMATQGVYPFWIKTQPTTGVGDAYNTGVSRNGAAVGLVTFTVPQDAPDTLYYIAENQDNMQGQLTIVDGVPGTGPGFWIQAAPGITGTMPATPNISSRDVYGVQNNGEDLGTIVFNVPYKTAQQFYYDLTNIGYVDLLTDLKFDQINNIGIDQFISTYGNIDGITYLNGRTLIFTNDIQDAEAGGWLQTTLYDPLPLDVTYNGIEGSYDTTSFDQVIEVPVADRYQIWTINLITENNYTYIQLSKTGTIADLEKFTIKYGTKWSNTQWFKSAAGEFEQIPLLSAVQDTLYYQDGTDPEIFGRIQLLDQTQSETIFIEDILSNAQYTSPNGIQFTNGLKVKFIGTVEPASYGSGIGTVVCTSTNSATNYITTSSTAGLYVGQQIAFIGSTLGGLVSGQTYYIAKVPTDFYFSVSETLGGNPVNLLNGTGTMTGTTITNREYYVSGVGSAIELLPTTNFITPESYVIDGDASTIATEPGELDYLTIDRAANDLNAWSRSNRWFHIDVINATATYNDTVAVLDNNYRAKRPIIQFRPDIRLYNMGTLGKQPVDIIDFAETDAFSNIEGSQGYNIDGYTLVEGSRVIFAADEDANVRNKIWVVEFITPDSTPPIPSPYTGQPIIHLVAAIDSLVLADESTLCLDGNTLAGITFWYDGVTWFEAQQKTNIQQAPLFNVYDSNGISFGNNATYPSTDFEGSKLFSYAIGDTGILDVVLKFPLQYLNLENVGDIVFDNNLYADTFIYTRDNVSVTLPISSGSAREYSDRTTYQRLIGWQNAVTTSKVYQQFKFTYDTATLKLDVRVNDTDSVPVLKIYVGSVFIEPSKYSYTRTSNSTTITLAEEYIVGDIIEVLVLSGQTSQVAFYQVPINLENNPLNGNSNQFTLGTIRQHYQSICENLPSISGPISGSNNTRDLGNIGIYGLTILQQSAPLTLAGYFLRSEDYNIFNAINYNSQEYIKFKNQLLNAVTQQEIQFQSTAQILDTALETITQGRVDSQPFYWSDMIPSGAVYIENSYTVSFITTNVFDTVYVYNYTTANYQGMNVYLNDRLLTRDLEYTVATDGPRITIDIALAVGDVVSIREYDSTYGSFIPNTPTKVGLYPSWEPRIELQKTSSGEQTVIIGHDGSITKTFDDLRDDVLLEFEKRIYNNLKLDGNPVPLTVYDVLPGQFRDTGFNFADITNILAQDFLSFVAWNKLDYNEQNYSVDNAFTYNYSSAQNKLNNQNLLGAWRGIYRYFYDTQQPEYTPWEMLGLSVKPDWWDDRYGIAPYTADNLVLWDDLEAGLVADPIAPYYLPEFARPGLSKVIPTGSEGELLPPFDSVMGTYDQTQFRKSWAVGDGGPVEASWWNSSCYPYAVMRLLAVTRPAKFFALFADRDLYQFQPEFDQYLLNNRYRLDANGIEVYGNGVSKASYIDWIVDYNRQTGLDSTADLTADLANLDVRLCYRLASFSDKQYIKLYTEKSSPNSTNTTFLIPDESYNLLLYKNQPFDRSSYSSVLVQKVAGGWSVSGYSTTQPFFDILQSVSAGKLQTITVSTVTVKVPTAYSTTVTKVPYGFVFSSETSVADFLLSYGKFLETQGVTFTSQANGYVLDWSQMVSEFLYWSQQGWGENAIINLNPLAFKFSVTKEQAVVDSIVTQTADNILLDQNRRELPTRNLNIVRYNNTFAVEPLNDQTLSFIDIKYTSYEHMIVLDNVSVFGDLIFEPITGARQSRLNLVAATSTEWNGSVDAQGFILNQDNVEEWTGLRTYSKGEIVKYKNVYWSALTIVQPSTTFNYNDWTQSDYTQIELGLLPNIANKANQLSNSYNINAANLEGDNDLLSYGLIGFRPRQYMASLNLDDVSQVNVYRQFLGSKGTVLAAELFSQANLGKEAGNYDIYENWAVQRAVYGANANRSFFELRLNRALLNANPSLIQVTLPQQFSQADQQILLSNVWRQSYKLTSTDILPVTTELPTDIGLPSAGYVNLDDVDLTVFDIDDPASLAANINTIGVGTSIWVAKVNDYDWGIYRASQVPGTISHVCDNLDNTSVVIFTDQHGLSVGDRIIIRFFDTEVDGVYDVLNVPSLTKIDIGFQFIGDRTVVNGAGLGFTLKTMRVAQPSDVLTLPYANQILPGARVWVDDNGAGLWQVIEKQQVFTDVIALAPATLDASEQYGASVAQAINRVAALVGSPRYGFNTGAEKGGVYVYVKSTTDQYAPISPLPVGDAILTLDVTGARGYGNSVEFGSQTWAGAGASASIDTTLWHTAGAFVVGNQYEIRTVGSTDYTLIGASSNTVGVRFTAIGAGSGSGTAYPTIGYTTVIYRDPTLGQPGVNPFAIWQLLTAPVAGDRLLGAEFGYNVAISQDERWMYISAPGVNKVYAYGRVDYQNQFVRASGDGVTTNYNINQVIQIDNADQLSVTVDDSLYLINVDYQVDPQFSSVVFTSPPPSDSVVTIQRLKQKQLDGQTYFNVPQSATSGSGTNAKFTIVRTRGEVGQPGADAGSVSVYDAGSGYSVANTITIAGASFGGTNNITLTISSVDGSGGITGFAIAYTPPALATVFSLNEYLFTADDIYSFSIIVDGVLQRPNIDYTFSNSTKDVTFINSPAQGAVIFARAQGYFTYVDTLPTSSLGLTIGDRFGHSVSCSTDGRQVMVGTPNITVGGNTQAGNVYVFDRNVQKFIYGQDPSSVSFTVLGTITQPVSVQVNNVFLTPETSGVDQGANQFTVSGNTVTLNTDLQVGDIVEIESNQFRLIQTIAENIPTEFTNYGAAVELCAYNCSLYVGAPQSSVQIYQGGVVERSVNQSRLYGSIVANNAPVSLTAGNTLRVNNIDVAVPVAPNNTVTALATAINAAVPNVSATVSTTGYLTIAVKNNSAAPAANKLQVAPGSVGTAFTDLGFTTFVYTQTIQSPYPTSFAGFGQSLSIDDTATNLVVGAPRATLYLETIWDDGTTDFDAAATVFFSLLFQSGAAYTYDFLPSASNTLADPGKFVFGDQISNTTVNPYDQFGISVNYTSGNLMVGAPGQDWEDSTQSNYGAVYVFENTSRTPAWVTIREQQPTVDVRLLNSVFLYDRVTSSTTEFLDFWNPLQGKILGAARQNLDYIGAVDPAAYNVGPVNIRGTTWSASHVGETWWDISTVRFIDPNQDDIVYAARRWGQTFPGSSVDVYQWIVSPTPPATYAGPGIPHDSLSYTINTVLGNDGTFSTQYFFWVRGLTDAATQKGKTLSVETVAQYISNPRGSGIAYIAPINASTIAIYNCETLIEAQDTVIHIEFDRELTTDNIHVEYELIAQDRGDGFLSDNLYRKMQDSFCGVDTAGNLVPDPNLSIAEQYGVQFRPRQSMFVDRFEALRNYLTRANNVLGLYPISESRTFTLLNSAEPEPSSNSGEWNLRVANLEILGFQNIYAVPLGYNYLVVSDSSNRGLWSIYEVAVNPLAPTTRQLNLIRVQNYNTPDYWQYINWYRAGYNSSTKVIAEVPTYSALDTLSLPIGSSVRVTANAQNKFEIYLLEDTGWNRVGLEDGTIEFDAELWDYTIGRFGFDVEVFDAQYFDQEPVIETRKIIQAINEELFIDDLLIERNRALVLMFNFVLSEFSAPEWLVKTSLIDVDHRIRELLPFQNYVRDNQEFVSDYIQEVKPYHVQIREFNLKYNGINTFLGDMTDFDVPAYFNSSLEVPQFTSPILLPYAHAAAQSSNVLSDTPATSTVWDQWPYTQWYDNYLLTLTEIKVTNQGSGYQAPPVVTIVGDADIAATAAAVVNSLGRVVAITILTAGSGYRATPSVVFEGGNGAGAAAYAVLTNSLIRDFRTVIKYDRFQYRSTVLTWTPEGTYLNGTLVRYDDRVWEAQNADGSSAVTGPTFDLENWILVPASNLSGVDRTMGFYVPGVNSPGLELPLLVDGVDYPGVQVWGDYFTGNIQLDAQYQSSFTDIFLGTRPTDINVDGGEFIGPYEGHAPEELVNGSEFDTLDMRVYTRPGADWQGDGHGFQIGTIRYTFNPTVTAILSWAGVVEHPVQIIVDNVTTGLTLAQDIDYYIDYDDETIELINGVVANDIINIGVYELGGGSQLYRTNFTGAEIPTGTFIVPVNASEIVELAIFINQEPAAIPTWTAYIESTNWNQFVPWSKLDVVNTGGSYYRALQDVPAGIEITNVAYWFLFVPAQQSLVTMASIPGANDGIAVVVFGYTTPEQYSWSTPITQTFVADVTLVSTQILECDNSLEGTNPANIIVTRNGIRLRPPSATEWIGDDSSVEFFLPARTGYSEALITNSYTMVSVWVDNVLQEQQFGASAGDYYVTPYIVGQSRQVTFYTPPPSGARILISVNVPTVTGYLVTGQQVQLISLINIGDVFQVTSFNDTAQQNLLTLTFVGPVSSGITLNEPYDSTNYSSGTVSFDSGSYDYTIGTSIPINDLYLQRDPVDASRLWVTLNGYGLFEGQDYTVQNGYLILGAGPIEATDVVVVTEVTNSVVPEAMAFRIFQDMRGVQATYRITPETTTTLTQTLSIVDDVVYVADASRLDQANPALGQLGVITIDGERITYRTRDLATNSVSGLLRGTAGTAIASHESGTYVYDIGRGNIGPDSMQNYIVSDTTLGDGTTTVFYAPSISVEDFGDSSSIYVESIEVYVGGQRQYNYSDTSATSQYRWICTDAGGDDSPLTIEFINDNDPIDPIVPPPYGVEVTILTRRGTWWYGLDTVAQQELSLQESTTPAARFLQGN